MPNTTVYKLNVCFDAEQLQFLKNAGYSVCISKLVNGRYNVVWASQAVSNNNFFEWTEEYQVFATQKSRAGSLVEPISGIGPAEICFGQTALMEASGYLKPAKGPLVGGSFALRANSPGFHIGVSQKIRDTFQPIYLSPTPTPRQGTETFTPMANVILFLSNYNITTHTMITSTECPTFPVSFSGNATQSVSYIADLSGGLAPGIWINGTPPEPHTLSATGNGAAVLSIAVASGKLAAMIPQSYSHEHGFEPLPYAYDAFKVAELINDFIHKFQRAR